MRIIKRILFVIAIIVVLFLGICFLLTYNWDSTATVAFDMQSYNIENPASIKIKIGGTFGTLPEPSKLGFYFGGWWTSSKEDAEEIKSGSIAKKDYFKRNNYHMTLYARWLSFGEKLWKDSVQDIICFEIEYENPDDGRGIVFFENEEIRDCYFEIEGIEMWKVGDDDYLFYHLSNEISHYERNHLVEPVVNNIYGELKRAIKYINPRNVPIDEKNYIIQNDTEYFSSLILTINNGKIDSLTFQLSNLFPKEFLVNYSEFIPLDYEITVNIRRAGDKFGSIPPLPDLPL